MSFKKSDFPKMREDFQKAVTDFEKKYNLKVEMGNINYTDEEFSSKVTFKSNNMFTEDAERKEFEKYCELYGFKPSDYKRQFVENGKVYEIIGFKLKSPKYSIRVKEIKTDKVSVWMQSYVHRMLG